MRSIEVGWDVEQALATRVFPRWNDRSHPPESKDARGAPPASLALNGVRPTSMPPIRAWRSISVARSSRRPTERHSGRR